MCEKCKIPWRDFSTFFRRLFVLQIFFSFLLLIKNFEWIMQSILGVSVSRIWVRENEKRNWQLIRWDPTLIKISWGWFKTFDCFEWWEMMSLPRLEKLGLHWSAANIYEKIKFVYFSLIKEIEGDHFPTWIKDDNLTLERYSLNKKQTNFKIILHFFFGNLS